MNVKVHLVADLFPMMNDMELTELAEDIRANGQREACLFYRGQLLDGRNRWRACELLGREPKVCKIEESHKFDPLQYVLSKNLHRREPPPDFCDPVSLGYPECQAFPRDRGQEPAA